MSKATFGAEPQKIDKSGVPEGRKNRKELGAIWEHTSRTNNPYMNIVLNLPKSELLQLIEESQVDGEGKVKLGLVALYNERQQANPRSPKFRIFRDIRGTEETQASSPTSESK